MTRRSSGIRPVRAGIVALALSLLVLSACGVPEIATRKSSPQPPSTVVEPSSKTPPSRVALDPLEPKLLLDPLEPELILDPLEPELILEPPATPDQKTASAPIVPINDDPDQLMGLAPRAVSHLLGRPSLLRTETPAQVWQYTADDCVLDIYLYAEDVTPERSRVTYYEIRGTDSLRSRARACFANIIARRNIATGLTPES